MKNAPRQGSIFSVLVVFKDNIVASALNDADGGHERELCVALEVREIGHAAVAHGGLYLINALFKVVMQLSLIHI